MSSTTGEGNMMTPVLYSFRRCPYAMRARLALVASGVESQLREVVLRDKPQAFLDVSPSATVPCLVTESQVIDESLDIMIWALTHNDPAGWLQMPQEAQAWINFCDGPFKKALDRTKYASRYPLEDPQTHRTNAEEFLSDLDQQIGNWIFDRPTLADYAILPFVRQFAFVDKPRFDAQPWPRLQGWLDHFLQSDTFSCIMEKNKPWVPDAEPVLFPPSTSQSSA